MMFSKKILNLSLIVISTCLLVFFLIFKKKSESSLDIPLRKSFSEKQRGLMAIPVRAIPALRGNLIIKLKSQGQAVPDKKIVMRTEVPGVIKNLKVKEGELVRKGDLLMELEDREYRLELKRKEALRLKYLSELYLKMKFPAPEKKLSPSELEKINKTQREYEKASRLYARGRISEEAFNKAKMNYEFVLIETGKKKEELRAASLTQAEIDFEIAKMKLEKTRIRAPFSGSITNIRVYPQESTGVGKELFTLVDIHKIKVEAGVLESEIGRIKKDQGADLRFSAYPDKVFMGCVKAISPIIDPEDKTCKVIIDLPNPEDAVKPGMYAEVEIVAEIYRDRLLIPKKAVLIRGGRKLVFALEDGLAKWRYIEVGVENEDYVEVLDGIREGDIVITEGHFTLAHDTPVKNVQQ